MPIRVDEAISQASLEIGITQVPITNPTGTHDQDIVQMLALLQAVADEVLIEDPYRVTLGDGVWVTNNAGTPIPKPTADSDIVLFDGRLCINGLKYRFLAAKGLEYGEAMRDFTARMNKLAARANGRVLDLDEEAERVQ